MLPHQWQPPSASIQAATQHLRLPAGVRLLPTVPSLRQTRTRSSHARIAAHPTTHLISVKAPATPSSIAWTNPSSTAHTRHDSRLDPPVWQKNCIVDAESVGHGATSPAPPRPLRPQERAKRTTAQRLRRTRPPPVPDWEIRRVGDKETATAAHLITAGEAKNRCSPLAHDQRSSLVAARSRPPGLIREANNHDDRTVTSEQGSRRVLVNSLGDEQAPHQMKTSSPKVFTGCLDASAAGTTPPLVTRSRRPRHEVQRQRGGDSE